MIFLLLAISGAAGSLLRLGRSRWFNAAAFSYRTFAVNIIGSFLIGLLWAHYTTEADENKCLLLTTGFCGSFTTFSAFSLKGLQLLQQSKFTTFFLYTFAKFGLTATYAGFKLIKT